MSPKDSDWSTSWTTRVIVPDVNLLLCAMNSDSELHDPAWAWWESAQRGTERIGLAWSVITAYIRLMTNAAVMPRPLSVEQATDDARAWLDFPITDALLPGAEHLHVMERLLVAAGNGGELTSDAHLAALALEHGGTVYSLDRDFARFPSIRWVNPLAS